MVSELLVSGQCGVGEWSVQCWRSGQCGVGGSDGVVVSVICSLGGGSVEEVVRWLLFFGWGVVFSGDWLVSGVDAVISSVRGWSVLIR